MGCASWPPGLRVLGSRLIVRRGEPVDVLAQVVSETGAAAVFAEEDYAPYAQARDARAVARLPVHFVSGPTLRHPLDVLKVAGTPYTVFSPYSRAWSALAPPGADDLLPAPCCLPPVSDSLFSFEFADDIASDDFPAGEREARQRLEASRGYISAHLGIRAHTRPVGPAGNVYPVTIPALRHAFCTPGDRCHPPGDGPCAGPGCTVLVQPRG